MQQVPLGHRLLQVQPLELLPAPLLLAAAAAPASPPPAVPAEVVSPDAVLAAAAAAAGDQCWRQPQCWHQALLLLLLAPPLQGQAWPAWPLAVPPGRPGLPGTGAPALHPSPPAAAGPSSCDRPVQVGQSAGSCSSIMRIWTGGPAHQAGGQHANSQCPPAALPQSQPAAQCSLPDTHNRRLLWIRCSCRLALAATAGGPRRSWLWSRLGPGCSWRLGLGWGPAFRCRGGTANTERQQWSEEARFVPL